MGLVMKKTKDRTREVNTKVVETVNEKREKGDRKREDEYAIAMARKGRGATSSSASIRET